jgi:hypothetical protein
VVNPLELFKCVLAALHDGKKSKPLAAAMTKSIPIHFFPRVPLAPAAMSASAGNVIQKP